MADLAEFAEELVGKTTKDAEKLLKILKEDYGIVPADFEKRSNVNKNTADLLRRYFCLRCFIV